MAHWLHRFTASRSVTGLYLTEAEGSWHAYRIDLRRRSGALEIEHQGEQTDTLETLVQSLPTGRPLYVALDVKGVLHRTVEPSPGMDVLSQAFPNLDADTVWTQELAAGNTVQLSIVRRDQIATCLKTFAQYKRFVWQTQLGPWGARMLASTQAVEGHHALQIGTHTLQFDRSNWVGSTNHDTEEAARTWSVGGQPLSGPLLVAYAAAVPYFTQPPSPLPAQLPTDHQRREGMHQRLYRRLGIGALTLAFLLVLGNAMAFLQLSGRNQELSISYTAIASQVEDYERLRADIADQRAFLTQLGWGDMPPFVFYSDQLGKTVPKDIRLTQLTLHPQNLQEESQNRRTLFVPNQIQVRGLSQSNLSVTRWLTQLESLPWVGEITNPEWQAASNEAGGTFSFTLSVLEP